MEKILTGYVQKAMSRAIFQKLEDGTYLGEVIECPGAIAFGQTTQACQTELQSVLEGWFLVKMRNKDRLPVFEGIGFNKVTVAGQEIARHG